MHLWVRCVEGLFGNVHRKTNSSACCRDAVHDGGQGPHVPLLWRVSSTQEICKETQSHIQYPSEGAPICLCCVMRLCVNCTHPRCYSSVCTARECCSTLGYCSRCCPNWARLTTTPVTMEIAQKLLSVTLCYDTAHPAPHRNIAHTTVQCNTTHMHTHHHYHHHQCIL